MSRAAETPTPAEFLRRAPLSEADPLRLCHTPAEFRCSKKEVSKKKLKAALDPSRFSQCQFMLALCNYSMRCSKIIQHLPLLTPTLPPPVLGCCSHPCSRSSATVPIPLAAPAAVLPGKAPGSPVLGTNWRHSGWWSPDQSCWAKGSPKWSRPKGGNGMQWGFKIEMLQGCGWLGVR